MISRSNKQPQFFYIVHPYRTKSLGMLSLRCMSSLKTLIFYPGVQLLSFLMMHKG